MVNISVKYKKHRFGWFKTKTADFPTEWEQLTPSQYVLAVKLLSKGYLTERDKHLFFHDVLKLNEYPLYNLPDNVLDYCDFMLNMEHPFKKVMIPQLVISNKLHFAPEDGFTNVKLGEWVFMDSAFIDYTKTKDEYAANMVIACMYREFPGTDEHNPKHKLYKGDVREPFNDNTISQRALKLFKLDIDTRNAIIFNYRIIRKSIEEQYPNLFPAFKPMSRIILGRESNHGWAKFMRNLCNGDLTKLDLIADTYLHNALQEAEDAIVEMNKQNS